MADRYDIAIIGSGPGGKSAAVRAAKKGLSHVLLEKTAHLSDTIFKYQRGKLIMATPDNLDLRSDCDFSEGIREHILETWDRQVAEANVNVQLNAEVTGVTGSKGAFVVALADGETVEADNVILAMGLQANLRKIDPSQVPGADLPHVQYQLDDPLMYDDEDIVVMGASDAAIENAVGLVQQNRVMLLNRGDGFPRAKAGNRSLILENINAGDIEHLSKSTIARVEEGRIFINTEDGEADYKCDRIIARLGALPPRGFLEASGIEFASKDRAAVPPLSMQYESNVPGLYVIGALAGYTLIKQCMNQGYDVVEYILGSDVKPVDEPLLEVKTTKIPGGLATDQALTFIKERIPLFSELTMLQLRDFMLESDIHVLKSGEGVFERGEFGDSLFAIADGTVAIQVDAEDSSIVVPLGEGEFFGEIGLIAGRPRAATVLAGSDVILVEIPRNSAYKLIKTFPGAKSVVEDTVLYRQLATILGQQLTKEDLADVIETAEVKEYRAGQTLIREGEEDDNVFVIRSGSVTISRNIGGQDVVVSYVPAGHYVGEMALFRNTRRTATVKAAIKCEAILLHGNAFRALAERNPKLRASIDEAITSRVLETTGRSEATHHSSVVEFLVSQGLGEATDVLIIDEALCVGCDNCEKACAATHNGVSRLNREAGPTYAAIHVPTSCRHCAHPHCMTDCPPDAINRAPNGEVYINDTCIGCGNCKDFCPYGVIQMAPTAPKRPSLLSWVLFGKGKSKTGDFPYWGGKSGQVMTGPKEGGSAKLAVKCDMCKGIDGGAACVRACPTGAAMRVSPDEFLNITQMVD